MNLLRNLFFAAALLLGANVHAALPKSNAAMPKADSAGIGSVAVAAPKLDSAPVIPFGDTLFMVYGSVGEVNAGARSKIIADNIGKLKDDLLFTEELLTVSCADSACSVMYSGRLLVRVTERQSRAQHSTAQVLAQSYRDKIAASVAQQRKARTWFNVAKEILLALLILAVIYFGIKYINILYRKTRIYIKRRKPFVKKLSYLLDVDKQTSIACSAVNAIRWLLLLQFLYICLLFLFRLFPETRWLSDVLVQSIVSPLKAALLAIWHYLPDLLAIAIIVFLFQLLLKALRILAHKVSVGAIGIKNFEPQWAKPTFQIVRVVVWIFMFIFIFPHLPMSDTAGFKGVSVFMGVLLSLGSTSIISNIVAGIIITYMNPFKDGDRIRMGEHVGDVVEKTALVTRLKTPKNEVITIPNSNILTAQTINYTASANDYGLILHSTVTMGYDVPWRRMHELLIEAGLKTRGVLAEPKPFVLQTALDDFCVEYQINVYTREANQMLNIYSELYANVQDVLNREHIDMFVPHQVLLKKEQLKTEN